MSAHIFSTKAAPVDESAYALLRNRSAYIAMSAATVGKLKMHPPVPREKALVVIEGPAPDSFLPSFDYDEELHQSYLFRYTES